MPFERPKPKSRLSKKDRQAILKEYYEYYTEKPSALNRKLPPDALREMRELLDAIGCLLISRADELAKQPGPIRQFLDDNPLPEHLARHLPHEFRVFCLALNALKVWVSAEQPATDRYLLGGKFKDECREAVTTCIVTKKVLTPKTEVEFHHPVRDGRPPIPLSKEGHYILEHPATAKGDDRVGAALLAIKKKGNRSWVQLRRGCEHLGDTARAPQQVDANSKSFAREAKRITGLSYEELLNWLYDNGK
jgi:hypothetical protein